MTAEPARLDLPDGWHPIPGDGLEPTPDHRMLLLGYARGLGLKYTAYVVGGVVWNVVAVNDAQRNPGIHARRAGVFVRMAEHSWGIHPAELLRQTKDDWLDELVVRL